MKPPTHVLTTPAEEAAMREHVGMGAPIGVFTIEELSALLQTVSVLRGKLKKVKELVLEFQRAWPEDHMPIIEDMATEVADIG